MQTSEELNGIIKELKELIRENKPFLGMDEAAEYLGISKAALYVYTSKGRIPFYKLYGRRNYFSVRDLNEFVLNEKNRFSCGYEMGSKTTTRILNCK